MLLIRCPYCDEERPELEFRHAGEAHLVRPSNMAEMSDEDFEGYFFIRQNPKGLVYERWRHMHGCARFFNAVRDTVSDKFLMTYRAGENRPAVPAPAGLAAYANRSPAELNVDEPATRKGTKQ